MSIDAQAIALLVFCILAWLYLIFGVFLPMLRGKK
jgi:hypothetical protein